MSEGDVQENEREVRAARNQSMFRMVNEVQETDAYVVVEKFGVAEHVADALDPRGG